MQGGVLELQRIPSKSRTPPEVRGVYHWSRSGKDLMTAFPPRARCNQGMLLGSVHPGDDRKRALSAGPVFWDNSGHGAKSRRKVAVLRGIRGPVRSGTMHQQTVEKERGTGCLRWNVDLADSSVDVFSLGKRTHPSLRMIFPQFCKTPFVAARDDFEAAVFLLWTSVSAITHGDEGRRIDGPVRRILMEGVWPNRGTRA